MRPCPAQAASLLRACSRMCSTLQLATAKLAKSDICDGAVPPPCKHAVAKPDGLVSAVLRLGAAWPWQNAGISREAKSRLLLPSSISIVTCSLMQLHQPPLDTFLPRKRAKCVLIWLVPCHGDNACWLDSGRSSRHVVSTGSKYASKPSPISTEPPWQSATRAIAPT